MSMTTKQRVKLKREIRAEIVELERKRAAAIERNDQTYVALMDTQLRMAKRDLGELDL